MYHVHFGLTKRLFDDGLAQDAGVYLGAGQQTVVANFDVALGTSDSVVVLTGPPGVGKTTVAAAALRSLTTRLALAWIGGGTGTSPQELLDWLLAEFGLSPQRPGRAERLQTWRQFLNEARATESRVFVIAERAEDLGVDGLRALAALTAADPNGCPGANLVLLGEPTLVELLRAPALASLAQRVRLRQTLEPLSATELPAYLAHHAAAAGGESDKVFAADAAAAIERASGNLPRVVNNLVDTAATLAARRREPRISAALIAAAARMLGTPLPDVAMPAATSAPMPAPIPAPAPTPTSAEPPAQMPGAVKAIEPAPEPAPTSAPRPAPPVANARPATAPPPPPESKPAVDEIDLPVLTDAIETFAAPPAPPAAPEPHAGVEADPDVLRQTQTMRALATATSIDDISNSMAETLFGEADLDMLSAALASAGWSDQPGEAPAAEQKGTKDARASGAVPLDPTDTADFASLLFGGDTPLELADEPATPARSPKTAAR